MHYLSLRLRGRHATVPNAKRSVRAQAYIPVPVPQVPSRSGLETVQSCILRQASAWPLRGSVRTSYYSLYFSLPVLFTVYSDVPDTAALTQPCGRQHNRVIFFSADHGNIPYRKIRHSITPSGALKHRERKRRPVLYQKIQCSPCILIFFFAYSDLFFKINRKCASCEKTFIVSHFCSGDIFTKKLIFFAQTH